MKQDINFYGIHQYLMTKYLETDRWPASQAEFDALADDMPVMRSMLIDPWDNPIQYVPPEKRGGKPRMFSMGPDGVAGTKDDIVFDWPD
ncbi:MAG: type II secretion system protein GspG [Phycisphaeraceae bacterium]|nr:type II secretion system protein GspG [Phycisphaeraceae bacterium]